MKALKISYVSSAIAACSFSLASIINYIENQKQLAFVYMILGAAWCAMFCVHRSNYIKESRSNGNAV